MLGLFLWRVSEHKFHNTTQIKNYTGNHVSTLKQIHIIIEMSPNEIFIGRLVEMPETRTNCSINAFLKNMRGRSSEWHTKLRGPRALVVLCRKYHKRHQNRNPSRKALQFAVSIDIFSNLDVLFQRRKNQFFSAGSNMTLEHECVDWSAQNKQQIFIAVFSRAQIKKCEKNVPSS